MLCQACNQNAATVRVIDVTHPKQTAPTASTVGDPAGPASGAPTTGESSSGGSSSGGSATGEPATDANAPDNCAHATTHEQFLCEACAQSQHDLYGQAKDISEVWKLLNAQQPAARKQVPGVACPDCGMTLRDFRQRGRLGCPRDYEIFGAQLRDLLERIHGASRHVGRGPNQDESTLLRRKRLDQLQQALASAVRDEAYEEAAKLRDEIKSLEV